MRTENVTCITVRVAMMFCRLECVRKLRSASPRGGWRSGCVAVLLCVATAGASYAQTFTSLASFNGSNGDQPNTMSLIQGTDGDLYGTTASTVFKITPQGALTRLHQLTYGFFSTAGLVQASDGNFYGTTEEGGPHNGGTIFKLTPSGVLTTLHSFCAEPNCGDGEQLDGGLVQATDGNLYGTTQLGGAKSVGTVFKITLDGKLTTLYSFCAEAGCTDGSYPNAALVQASDGNLYGTTITTVFKLSLTGQLTTIHRFDGSGAIFNGLIQADDGNFYGTIVSGGPHNDGSVVRMTPSGVLSTVYTFCSLLVHGGCPDGIAPYGALIQAQDGDLYGTTQEGGANNNGTIFKVTLAGKLATLHAFCNKPSCDDGDRPYGGLVQATNGTFYGTTWGGGTDDFGTVFSLSEDASPFVQPRPGSATEGSQIWILGQDFSSSSVVRFGGTQAITTALTGTTFISATVPVDALTGPVSVSTGNVTLTNARRFKVLPTITSIPSHGSVGSLVAIDGTGLAQTTKVMFGGAEATDFTVNSDTKITANVPAAAKTGKIAVTTTGGTANSQMSFTVN
jgi:uncharacterized repeat protein (TIGR03803 family)